MVLKKEKLALYTASEGRTNTRADHIVNCILFIKIYLQNELRRDSCLTSDEPRARTATFTDNLILGTMGAWFPDFGDAFV